MWGGIGSQKRRMDTARLGLALGIVALAGACTPAETESGGWITLEATLAVEKLAPTAREAPAAPVALTLADARASLPFAFALPGWAPEGFVLQEAVEVILPDEPGQYSAATLTWLNADDDVLTLTVSQNGAARLAGAGTTEPALVNGQAATLTRAGLKSGPKRLTLSWTQNGVNYALAGDEGAVTVEALVRMAESSK